MHRAYQNILPCQNKLLQKKWDDKYYEVHRQKVREARSMVDTKAPTTYMHLHLKLKKMQLEEERLATIERDNRILLEKMAFIMRTTGRIDNYNNYEAKSLNREKRQRELLRITAENQEMLRRILMRQPLYDHKKWEQDWEENLQFIDNISHYPKNWWEKPKKSARSARSGRNTDRSQEKEESKKDEKKDEKNEQNEEQKNVEQQQEQEQE